MFCCAIIFSGLRVGLQHAALLRVGGSDGQTDRDVHVVGASGGGQHWSHPGRQSLRLSHEAPGAFRPCPCLDRQPGEVGGGQEGRGWGVGLCVCSCLFIPACPKGCLVCLFFCLFRWFPCLFIRLFLSRIPLHSPAVSVNLKGSSFCLCVQEAPFFSVQRLYFLSVCLSNSPWYNWTGWLDVKHQIMYLLSIQQTPLPVCLKVPSFCLHMTSSPPPPQSFCLPPPTPPPPPPTPLPQSFCTSIRSLSVCVCP